MPDPSAPMKIPPCALVVVAAGQGTRFGGYKQLATIAGVPLIVRTLKSLMALDFQERIVVLPESFLSDGTWHSLVANHPEIAAYRPIIGAAERALSVRAGILASNPSLEFIAVHDGARPFPPIDTTVKCLNLLSGEPTLAAAIVSSPMTDTVKQLETSDDAAAVLQTLNRQLLCRAETPQVARRAMLIEALSLPGAASATDEGQCLEAAGHRTACVLHESWNIKVTRPTDVALAETILRTREVAHP